MQKLYLQEQRLNAFEQEKMNLALERLSFSNRIEAEKTEIQKQIERRFRSA